MELFKVITFNGIVHYVRAESVLKVCEMFNLRRGLVITAI